MIGVFLLGALICFVGGMIIENYLMDGEIQAFGKVMIHDKCYEVNQIKKASEVKQ